MTEWDISRLGQRADAYLETIFCLTKLYRTEYDGLVFFWKNEEQYLTYSDYRLASERDATDLPPEEVANAIKQILIDSVSLPLADLSRACAQLFGFARTGTNIDATMQRGLNAAIKKKDAKIENGRGVTNN